MPHPILTRGNSSLEEVYRGYEIYSYYPETVAIYHETYVVPKYFDPECEFCSKESAREAIAEWLDQPNADLLTQN